MNFYFCLAVLFVPAVLGTSTENNDDPISEYSRSSTIGNSDSNYNAGRTGNDTKEAGFVFGHDDNIYGKAGNGNAKNIYRRALAKDTACQLPEELKDSEVNCRIYNAKVVCNHTCMFGYTFSEGIERQMECHYKEDKWTPVPEFESCEPFTDCGLTMGPGGGFTCQKDFMDKGPICEIFCEPYEDKDAVKAATYSCDIDGKWTPELPFCATPGSGLNLVPPPSGRKIPSDHSLTTVSISNSPDM